VKRSTAVRHLVGLAEEGDRLAAMPNFEWPLREMWAADEVLESTATLDAVTVILMLGVPVDELPWLALHPAELAVAETLRLPKLPVQRYARSVDAPAWNPIHRRVVRFWDGTAGLDGEVIEALQAGKPVAGVEPPADEYLRQMGVEVTQCRAHLDMVLDRFWEPGWRRKHRAAGIYPEDHLWRAAQAVRDIEAALEHLAG